MDTIEKLKLLSDDSQYDLACACGTGKDDRRHRGLDGKWLYPVSLPQGGYSVGWGWFFHRDRLIINY